MITVRPHPNYIVMEGDRKDFIILEKHFNRIPQYQLLRSFRGTPRPEVFLHHIKNSNGITYYMSMGLWKELKDVCAKNNISINLSRDLIVSNDPITLDEFKLIAKDLVTGLEPRDYQIEAAWKIIKYRMSTSELATRAGKTLICSLVLRYLMQYRGVKKVLFIVPSIHLVKQGIKDFKEYMDFFQLGEVWAGADIVGDENCIIGTFQSIILRLDKRSAHYNPDFFAGVDCVVIDEAHKASCKSIDTILSQPFMKEVKIKFGVTGTIPKDHIDRFKVLSLLGPTIQHIQSSELIEAGFLAEPVIQQVRISHDVHDDLYINTMEKLLFTHDKTIMIPKSVTIIKHNRPDDYKGYLETLIKDQSKAYHLEMQLAQLNPNKLEHIYNITKEPGNSIVFIHNIQYGKDIRDYLEQNGLKVHIINGSISLKKRQKILTELENSDNNVLVGSLGCVSTGLTFNNIVRGVFAQSFKSDIITKQSLGRLMLKNDKKDKFYLFDLVDEYPTKKLISHARERMSTYKKENLI